MFQGMRARLWRAIFPAVSADYCAWRKSFLRSRLKLTFGLAIACCLTFMALNSYAYFIDPQAYSANRVATHGAFLTMYVATLACLSICLIIFRLPVGHRHPEWIFVAISWSNTLTYQIFATCHGIADPRIETWSLLFPTQAALVPVCLPLHLISQLGLASYFFVVNTLLGFTIHHQPVYSHLTLWIWFFWLCLICDIAVYLYEKLQRSEFESKRTLRLFVHAVSHDLRSPVTSTAIVLNNLLKQAADHKIEVKDSIIQRLLQGNKRQLALIDSLRIAHQTERQEIVLRRQSLQLSTVIDTVLADLADVIKNARTHVKNCVDSELPLIEVDATQLWRVYSNLINNAIRHNAPSLQLTLDAKILKTRNVLYCTVKDNGVGILPEQCPTLFKLYTRGHQARCQPGLGLGLYLCQQIITAHGGEIGVMSTPHSMTTFWFTLPLV